MSKKCSLHIIQVRDFIRRDPQLNESILMLQPLELGVIHAKLRVAGIECDVLQLGTFLRTENVVLAED